MLCTYILCATPGNNFAYRPQRQEGLLGTGTGGGGGEEGKNEDSRQASTRKIKDAVDRRQNNRMLRQCRLAQQLQYHAIAAPTAMQDSHKDNVRSSAV